MIKNIVDLEGNVIGQLELPDGTSQQEWDFQLTSYAHGTTFQNVIPDVTPRQMRQALSLMGITEQQISDAIDSFPEPQKTLARIEWEYSTLFQRHRQLVIEVQRILEWTDEQVDQLWVLAGSL